MALTGNDLAKWQADRELSDRAACALLGISRNPYLVHRNNKRKHLPRVIALALWALLNGAE